MPEEQILDHDLAEILPQAYDLLAPFFDPANNWAGQPHEHLAFLALHEKFPDLKPDQLNVVVSAMKKLFSAKAPTLDTPSDSV